MKGLTQFLLLPLVAAGPLVRRQVPSADKLADLIKSGKLGGGKGLGSLMGRAPSTKAAKVEFITPKIRKDAKRIRLTYGPYKLRAANSKAKLGNGMSMDPAGTGYSYMAGEDFPRDVTLLATTSAIYDDGGKNKIDTAKGLYNHHNVFFDIGHHEKSAVGCEGGKKSGGSPGLGLSVIMAGATEEGDIRFAATDSSIQTGYYLPKDAKVSISLDVVNYNNEERTIWMIGEMEYLPGKAAGLLPAAQQVIDLGMCSGVNGVDIRPPVGQKRFTIEGKDIIITRDGYFVYTRGHLHDGGLNMEIKINGKTICDSKVLYGGEGHITKGSDGKERGTINTTTECEKPLKVSKGDRLSMVANYDLEKHPAREVVGGGMGAMSMGAMGGGGHGDGHGEAEQMALMIITFAGRD